MLLDQRGLYPYEPPQLLAYRLPPGSEATLGFPAAAALTAAAWRRSLALCGEPQLYALLGWLRENGAAEVQKAERRMAKVGACREGREGQGGGG